MLKMRKAWLVVMIVGLSLLAVGVAWAAGSFTDTSISDFSGGTGCLVSPSAGDAGGDGEVVLGLASGGMLETFPGSSLPAGWNSGSYGGSGTLSVSGDVLIVNDYWASPSSSVNPPRVLEFDATFGPSRQHAGFGSFDLNTLPWAIFSTADPTAFPPAYGGGQLYAWTRDGATSTYTAIGTAGYYLNTPHRYRIAWTSTQVVYSIDGSPVATDTTPTISTAMYPVVSDPVNDSTSLVADWMRIGPYNTSCTYTSRVFDKGDATSWWNSLTPTLDLPAGTSATFQVRFATTLLPTPDWTGWLTPTGTSGTGINRQTQYMQYEVTLTTSDAQITPAMSAVTVTYGDSPTAVTMQSLAARSAGAEMGLTLPVGLILVVAAGYIVSRKRRRILR